MTSPPQRHAIPRGAGMVVTLLPGLAIACAMAGAALVFRSATGLTAVSPMILAIILGLLVQNILGTPAGAAPGLAFAMRRLLRLGIVLLGFQLTLSDVATLGLGAVAVIALTLAASFLAITAMGRVLGVPAALTSLIAAGTAVCGASAVVAANTVARGSDEDVAYALASITVLGSIAMLVYPLLAGPLGLDDLGYGLWTGATVHEVAQVAAAAFQLGEAAGQYGTVAKLTRVVMLAPLILAMAAFARSARDGGGAPQARVPMPWFVFGFVGLVALNSAVDLPAAVREQSGLITTFLLSAALAALGLQVNFAKFRAKGLRPLLLGLFGWFFIAGFGLGAMALFGYWP